MSLDSEILRALRENGAGITAAELAERAGVTSALLSPRIEELRSLGYDIEVSPHSGYRLLSSPDVLHADDLLSRLGNIKVIGRDIRVFESTPSTNDVIEKFAQQGLKEGVVVFAETQTKGRGRMGRSWISPAKQGLWFSVLLRPRLLPQQTIQITVAAATAVRRAIAAQTGLKPRIKWPNDILLDGRKVSGILNELTAELDLVRHIVLGIGIDVNVDGAELPGELRKTMTSLKEQLGQAVSRPALAARVLRELDYDYDRSCAGKFNEVADEWEEYCNTLGQQVSIRVGDRQIRGRAECLSEDGVLLVRTEHGHLERIISGDVTVE